MKQNAENGKFVLQNELRTWSDVIRRTAATQGSSPTTAANPTMQRTQSIGYAPSRRWGGCVNGCNHAKLNFPRRVRRQNTLESAQAPEPQQQQNEKEDHLIAAKEEEKAIEGGVNITGGVNTAGAENTTGGGNTTDGGNTSGGGNASSAKQGKKSRTSSKSPSDSGAPVESADTNLTARTEALNRAATKEPAPVAGVENGPSSSSSNAPIATEDSPIAATTPPDSTTNTEADTDSNAPPTEPEEDEEAFSSADPSPSSHRQLRHRRRHDPPVFLSVAFRSGLASPASASDDDSDYFDTNVHQFRTRLLGSASQSRPSTLSHAHAPSSRSDASRSILAQMVDEGAKICGSNSGGGGESGSTSPRSVSPVGGGLRRSGSQTSPTERAGSKGRKGDRTNTWSSWSGRDDSLAGKTGQETVEDSGMMLGRKADALGDVELEAVGDDDELRANPSISVTEAVFEELKARERKGFGEVY